MKGYNERTPNNSKTLAIWEQVILVSDKLLDEASCENDSRVALEKFHSAGAALVGFDIYPRPVNLLALRGKAVLAPSLAAPLEKQKWHIQICPSTEAQTTKTGRQDDTMQAGISGRTVVEELLGYWRLKVAPGHEELMFRITHSQFAKHLKEANTALELSVLLTPGMLRHGGASHDAFCGAPQADIQLRGTWEQLKSCQRYMKAGVYMRNLNKLSLLQVKAARLAERNLLRKFKAVGHRLGFA